MTAGGEAGPSGDQRSRPPGRLFVLSGPSGVGKSTVVQRLRERCPDLWVSISATTREPRPGERDGQTYFFVSRQAFGELVTQGQMLEWAEFAGNLYGTPAGPVRSQLQAGRDVLLEIEVNGARQVRAATGRAEDGGAILVFLAPPSVDELARRLAGRGTEDRAARDQRLAAARAELAAEREFDHTVVNQDVESATAALLDLLADRHPGSPDVRRSSPAPRS